MAPMTAPMMKRSVKKPVASSPSRSVSPMTSTPPVSAPASPVGDALRDHGHDRANHPDQNRHPQHQQFRLVRERAHGQHRGGQLGRRDHDPEQAAADQQQRQPRQQSSDEHHVLRRDELPPTVPFFVRKCNRPQNSWLTRDFRCNILFYCSVAGVERANPRGTHPGLYHGGIAWPYLLAARHEICTNEPLEGNKAWSAETAMTMITTILLPLQLRTTMRKRQRMKPTKMMMRTTSWTMTKRKVKRMKQTTN